MFHRKIYLYAVMTLCLQGDAAFAAVRDRIAVPQTRPLTWGCVIDAAERFNLPLAALVGILATEGGKTGEALSNTNGTWDLGGFQVNTCHVNDLLRAGFSPEAVLQDGCTNAQAAAWVLRKEYDRTRTWARITPAHRICATPTWGGSESIWPACSARGWMLCPCIRAGRQANEWT